MSGLGVTCFRSAASSAGWSYNDTLWRSESSATPLRRTETSFLHSPSAHDVHCPLKGISVPILLHEEAGGILDVHPHNIVWGVTCVDLQWVASRISHGFFNHGCITYLVPQEFCILAAVMSDCGCITVAYNLGLCSLDGADIETWWCSEREGLEKVTVNNITRAIQFIWMSRCDFLPPRSRNLYFLKLKGLLKYYLFFHFSLGISAELL